MKHLIVLLLALLLTGCTVEVPDDTASPSQPPTTDQAAAAPAKQPTALRTNRALSIYDTGIPDCRGIYPMGENMVLIS